MSLRAWQREVSVEASYLCSLVHSSCSCPFVSFHHFSAHCLKPCLPFPFRFSIIKQEARVGLWNLSFLSSPALQAEVDWAAWIMYRYVLYKAWDAFYQFYCTKQKFWEQRCQCVHDNWFVEPIESYLQCWVKVYPTEKLVLFLQVSSHIRKGLVGLLFNLALIIKPNQILSHGF